MIRKTIWLFILLISSVVLFSFNREKKFQKSVNTLIIDPGHGGSDQGARGDYSTEAMICLQIGLKLGKMIEKEIPDVKVLYTRTTDIIPGNKSNMSDGLRYRADFANQSGADLFISIHCNSAPKIRHRERNGYRTVKRKGKSVRVPNYRTYYTPNPAYGTETYVWAAHESDHKGDMINANAEEIFGESDSTLVVPDENDPVMKALKLIYQKKYFQNSVKLAELVEQEFVNQGRFSRGVKQRNHKGIWVLHATGMPSVLVETGFLSNKEEEAYLNSEKGQMEICTNITAAIKNYISWLEKLKNGNNTTNGGNNETGRKEIKSEAALTRSTSQKPGK